MDADTMTAMCATAIASASFIVSVQQTRASREHNRRSVLPVLQIWNEQHSGEISGMSLVNHGLGPAFVTHSRVWLDGAHVGHWGRAAMRALRDASHVPLSVVEMNRLPWVLPAGDSRFLLSVDNYDDTRHGDLWDLIRNRIAVEFVYESIYGTESFRLPYRLETIAE